MFSAQSNRIFSIVKNTPSHLILEQNGSKLFCKNYRLTPKALPTLKRRQTLSHPNLIKLNHIEYSANCNQQHLQVALVHQHYCQTLESCMSQYGGDLEECQLMNTLQPILQCAVYLNKQQWQIEEFSLGNIVVTEDETVKIIDSFFHKQFITEQSISDAQFNEHSIYESLANIVFKVLYPQQKAKNWDYRLKLIKNNCTKKFYSFFMNSIYSKSTLKQRKHNKSRLIKKKNKKQTTNKKSNGDMKDLFNTRSQTSTSETNDKEPLQGTKMVSSHSGKENQLCQ